MSSRPYPVPAMTQVFKDKVWNDMEPEELQNHLMQAIIDDPATDVSNVSVVYHSAEKDRDEKIELIGKVDSELDRKRIEEIVSINTKGEIPVENSLSLK